MQWTQTFDFSQDAHGWTLVDVNNAGVWSGMSGGWIHTCPTPSSVSSNRLRIKRAFNATKITQVTITYDAVEGDASPYGRPGTIRLFYQGNEVAVNAFDVVTGDSQTRQLSYNDNVDTIDIRLWASSVTCTGSILLKKVVVVGEGNNPLSQVTPTWCHLFDFVNDGDGGFVERNTGEGTYITGAGWRDGTTDRVVIEKTFSEVLTLTEVQAIADVTCGGFTSQVQRAIRLIKNGVQVSEALLGNCANGADRIYTWAGQADANKININMWASNGGSHGTITIKSVRLKGFGVNPFYAGSPADTTQTQLDTTFNAVKSALQANPSTHPQTEFDAYRDAIISAFGVTFANETGADAWGQSPRMATALHFARLGLEATADAFQRWVEGEAKRQGLCVSVDKFALFQRVMGQLTLNNSNETWENFAYTSGNTISVYKRPKKISYWVFPDQNGDVQYVPQVLYPNDDPQNQPAGYVAEPEGPGRIESHSQFSDNIYYAGRDLRVDNALQPVGLNPPRQAVMTPNNLIHELGHKLSRSAGFGTALLGSIEQAIDAPGYGATLHDNYSRHGMGEGLTYLRGQFYEHARIEDRGTEPPFTPIKPPYSGDPYYDEIYPNGYLLHDLLGNQLSLWQSSLYTNLYGINARLDTFGINTDTTPIETVADAFLSWVRDAFGDAEGESQACGWISFFANNIGKFLRNAVIYNYPGGMVQYYKDQGVLPSSPIAEIAKSTLSLNVRQTPDILASNILYSSLTTNLANPVLIFGLINEDPGDGSPYWLLVGDSSNRLVWVASSSVDSQTVTLDSLRDIWGEFNDGLISPDRLVQIDTIVGES